MSDFVKVYTVKVTNKDTNRVDIHRNLKKEDVEYLKLAPTLVVEVLNEEAVSEVARCD